MTSRLTMLGTLQYSSSFSGSELFSAKASHTTSSMLDDLQLDMMPWIHERIYESLSLASLSLSLRIRRDARVFSVERKREKR